MGKNKIFLLATTALIAVGCSSDNQLGGPASGDVGPSGLPYDRTIGVMSSDTDGDSVRVSDSMAAVELHNLVFEEGNVTSFELTMHLPDGSTFQMSSDQTWWTEVRDLGAAEGLLLTGETYYEEFGDYDRAQILFGYGWGVGEVSQEEGLSSALFALARVQWADADLDGYYTYLAAGDTTAELPAGSMTYSGGLWASAYSNGELVDDYLGGEVWVGADFEGGMVDIWLEGGGELAGFWLEGNDLVIEGSGYGGELWGEGGSEAGCGGGCWLTGDVLGAFFGTDAEATAGVFGVQETEDFSLEGQDLEFVGGFGAYANFD